MSNSSSQEQGSGESGADAMRRRPPPAIPVGDPTSEASQVPTWTEAAEYLVAAKALLAVPASAVDLAHMLRDGTHLCELVKLLSNNKHMEYTRKPQREVSLRSAADCMLLAQRRGSEERERERERERENACACARVCVSVYV